MGKGPGEQAKSPLAMKATASPAIKQKAPKKTPHKTVAKKKKR